MNSIERNTEKLAADLKRVIHDSEELLEASGEAVTEKAKEVRSRLRGTLERARRTCRELEEQALRGAKAADELVRQHPYESIGVALGIGLVLGILARRK